MAGFSGSTGVSKKYVDDAIQQSTANILKVADMAGTSTNMTIVRQKIVKYSNLVLMQVVLKANASINKNTAIMTVPYYHDATSYYPIYAYDQDSGATRLLLLSGTTITYFDDTALAANHRLAFERAYINT